MASFNVSILFKTPPTNVIDGSVASGSKEAVNGGQLFTTNTNVSTAQTTANNALANAVTADGKAVAAQTTANSALANAATADGKAVAAQTTANSALTEAQKGLNFTVNGTTPADKVGLGETVNFANGTNTTAVYDSATNTYKYNVVAAPTFAGTVTSAGLQVNGNSTVTGISNLNGGAALNNKKITDLLDGTVASGSKEAVNGGQLFTTNTNVSTAQTTANNALANAATADGKAVAAQTTANNALANAATADGKAVAAQTTANSALTEAQKGFALQAADGSKVQKNLGEAVEVVGADSNITTKVVSGKVAIELNKNLNNLTGISVNDGTDGANGSTVIGKDGLSVKDGSGTTIAGVDNTALTVKDAAGVNAETSINKAINTLNASQGETDKFAVKYDKTGTTPNYDSVTFTSTTAATGVKDTTTGKITTTGGTSLNNVASSGDYTDVANAGKGVNAGDLNNAVVDATNAVTDKGLIFGANAGTDHTAKLGTKVTVKGADTNTDFTKFDSGTNLMTQVDTKGNITVALKKDLSVDSLTAGTAPGNTTTLNKDGVTTTGSLNVVDKTTGDTIASLDSTALSVDGNKYTSVNEAINALNKSQGEISGVSVKYDNPAIKDKVTLEGTNGTTITNLKGGEVSLTSKDAVNGSQLYGTYIAMVDALGGNSSYNSDGTVTLPTYAVNGKDYKNVGAALSALDAGWVLNSNGVAGAAIKAGDTVDIGTASTENNLAVVKTGNTIDFSLNKDLKGLTSVETTDGAGNTSTRLCCINLA